MKRKRIVIMLKNLSVATATIVLVAALGTASFAGSHTDRSGGEAATDGAGNADERATSAREREAPAGDASDGGEASGGRSVDGSANADGARPTPTGRAKAAEVACLAANANSNLSKAGSTTRLYFCS
jgi:hypothetical protein